MFEKSKKRNEIEDRNFGPTLSNSRSKGPILAPTENFSDFRVSIDRLTIVANLSVDAFETAVKHWLKLPFFEQAGSGFQVLDYSNCYEDDFGHKHDYVEPEQVAYIEKPRMLKDKIRIDFNPNHGMETDAGKWLLENVIGKLPEKHFSRCDIAFDIYDHPEVEHYQVWGWGMRKQFIYGENGDLQTSYFGSRSSEKQIRLYNKKIELEKRHGKMVNVSSLWRLELQLRGSKVENYVHEVEKMLESFYLPDWQSRPTLQQKMLVYSLVHEPIFYSEATERSRKRYRRIIRDAKPENGLSEELVKCFVNNYSSLDLKLQQMMQRFRVKNAEVRDEDR